MKKLWANKTVRRLLLYRLAEASLFIAVLGVCVVGYGKTKEARVAAEQAQSRLAGRPQALLRVSTVQSELRARAHDVERILQLVLNSHDLVPFIEDLEATARQNKIILEVPSIIEVPAAGVIGQSIAAHEPFRAISLKISAHGAPENLLQYIHDVEHGAHVVSLRDWDIHSNPSAAFAAASSALAVQEAGDEEKPAPPAAASQLNAEVILIVHNEKYSP